VLRAAGWDGAQLRRVALLEGLITGALGGVAGALLGLGIAALLAAAATTASMLLVLAALAVPLRWLNRVAPATVLAADE
jgi:ABC-type antimicrobial peptide transport system permease subunit